MAPMPAGAGTMIEAGTEFRHVRADSNPLWRVTRRVGRGIYEAVCINEPVEINGESYDSDFAGEVDVFKADTIRRAMGLRAVFQNLESRDRDFYDGLAVGTIVHYHNGFGQFVRCEVVRYEDQMALLPVALVGHWQRIDLPRRNAAGDIGYSTGGHFFGIASNPFTPWRPSTSCVYEAPDAVANVRRHGDPAGMPVIDLTVPEPTDEQAATEALYRARNDAIAELQRRHDGAADASILLSLRVARDILNAAIGED